MNPDIAYVTTYACPRCGERLEAVVDEWQDWRRCPSCGRASRPPFQRRARPEPVEEVLYIGSFTTGPLSSVTQANGTNGASPVRTNEGWQAPAPPPWAAATTSGSSGTFRRAMLGGGLLLSIVLALVSVAQKNPGQAGVFGGVAFLIMVFLIQSSRQP